MGVFDNFTFKYKGHVYGIAQGVIVKDPWNVYDMKDGFPIIGIPEGLLDKDNLPSEIIFECRGYPQTDKFLEWLDTIDWYQEKALMYIDYLIDSYKQDGYDMNKLKTLLSNI